MQIHIHTGGQQQGPFTIEQINQILRQGELPADSTLAWYEGCTNWIPLRDVPGVAESSSQVRVFPPPASQYTAAPPTIQSPALWNPDAAASWSLLFSPAFGAYLHARNAEALGRRDEAKANRVWFYISLAFLGAGVFVPAIVPTWTGIVLLIAWYFSLGKKQALHVKEMWGDRYVRKPWKKPLLIAFGCLIGLFVVALVVELAFGSQ